MKWLDNMNRAISYIEENLYDKTDYEKVAQMACCSVYHFQRIFTFITDITLSEYVRRRKMTAAAFELQNSDIKVVDLALKYGYESPEAFSRAFHSMHGVSPSGARKEGVEIKAYPRISFQITIKGETEMNYRIEKRDAFDMFGVSADINAAEGKPFIEIPEFWGECIKDGTVDKIRSVAGLETDGQIHGALYNFRDSKFSYMICYNVPLKGLQEGFEKLSVPSLTWAIFSTGLYKDGQSTVQDIWKRIGPEWFPASNYEHAVGPEFEMTYYRGNSMYETEVMIPVIKK